MTESIVLLHGILRTRRNMHLLIQHIRTGAANDG